MGLTWSAKCITLFLAVQLAHLLQVVRAKGKCDLVFQGFSNCLLKLGDSMANYPPDLEEKENLQTICTYWDNFHSCSITALADCQDGATEIWEKLKTDSTTNLKFSGSLFELCGSRNQGSKTNVSRGLTLLLTAFSALVTWLAF
ncbi:neuritin [Aplochiton taeniatus]